MTSNPTVFLLTTVGWGPTLTPLRLTGAVSLASLLLSNLPGISILRLMRTFRVLRLFNKLRSLRTLINALASSLVPVANAFVIMVLVLVIFAILGVELFQSHNPDTFGSFDIAMYTVLCALGRMKDSRFCIHTAYPN